ncbi:MAG TPA: GNAT family N-acetyltransferase [Roseiflexaceae bacterium]|jgi:RimJ/RimL family protein N-acetyltransferase
MSQPQTEVRKRILLDGRAITIRPLGEDDYEALLAFGTGLPQDDLLYLENDFQNPDIIRRLVNAWAAENWRQIVAEADGAIVSYSAVRRLAGWSSHVADIHLTVDSGWRRSGLGTAMAQAIFDAARDLGVNKVIVEMLERQNAGRAIFERLGFHVEGMLSAHARDRHGERHNLLILAYHVS